MILTDTELLTVSSQYGDIDEYKVMRDLARAVERAVLAKLAAGVSVEPVVTTTAELSAIIPVGTKLFTETAIAAARVQENERCAKLVEFRMDECEPWINGDDIRALIGAP